MVSRRHIPIAEKTRTSSRNEDGAAIAIFTIIMLGVAIPAFFFIAWAFNFFKAQEQAAVLAAIVAKSGASQTVAYKGYSSDGLLEIDCPKALAAAETTWQDIRSRVADGSGYQMTSPTQPGMVVEVSCTRPSVWEPTNKFTVVIQDTYRGNAITGWLGITADFTVDGEAVLIQTEK